ncbi:carcinine hydrolase/isopenicillin-N N-acyltransferase family protein [Blastopirellula retiformator]|uniref:Acyl-coenzyme A:6-aminopenicillanic acid acyl-transferase n=1 Tax=Blastopirellula retiformator TaxID=2527970 RepID=A0A5C5V774_9BACT|nr:carcinine hydrolase/isopenicillin-N N-acyltransferase family protein [Blastopirellula retiformator]TWT34418.1 Acyl-coenzyme A:6-aminopenicillanic acid acyl-transferase [Blastopirellula retiformator]
MKTRIRLAIAMVATSFSPLAMVQAASACTTAVISGRATVDGRPILWKNRDTRTARRNEVARLTDGDLKAIAVVNAGSTSAAWMGVNEAGFCIENSLARDLATKGKKSGPGNGGLMKLALETCKTVEDFKKLLDETDKTGRRTVANFGVIDAQGGAAIFETGPASYVMFDANDPEVAPDGILVRANFSTAVHDFPAEPTAEQLQGTYSRGRYLRACTLLDRKHDAPISVEYVIRHCTRDLMDSDLQPIPGSINAKARSLPSTISTADTISRAITVSAGVFHGVKPGEDPGLTTMWTMLGEPNFTIAVPCWVAAEKVSDHLAGDRGAPVGELSNSLRTWNYLPEQEVLRSKALQRLWSELWPVEEAIIAKTLQQRDTLVETTDYQEVITMLHQQAASEAHDVLEKAFFRAKTIALANPGSPLPDFAQPRSAAPVGN